MKIKIEKNRKKEKKFCELNNEDRTVEKVKRIGQSQQVNYKKKICKNSVGVSFGVGL